jgi:glycosyltransferase involved in cell wall biosynthesis
VYVGGGRLRFGALREDGVEYRWVPMAVDRRVNRLLDRFPSKDPHRPQFASRWYHYAFARAVAKDLARDPCDLVHIFNISQFVPVIRRMNPSLGIGLHMQCEWLTQLDPSLVEARLDGADLVLGCSEFIAREVADAFPRYGDRCKPLYNGVDSERFVPANGHMAATSKAGPKLLFVGRVSPEKGIHVLLESLGSVSSRFPGVQLDVIGGLGVPPPEFIVALSKDPKVRELVRFYDGDYGDQLRSCTPANVAEQVRYIDNVPYGKLAQHYRECDVFVFPSVWDEPFGMPIVEAMACGVPVVATRGGGIPELIEHGRTGLLVDRGDASALTDALNTLLADEPLRRRMGQAGRERVMELFTWDRIASDLVETYRPIVDRRGLAVGRGRI